MSLSMSLGEYEVLGPLGKGGFGRVWLARAPAGSPGNVSLVAIKRMRRNKLLRQSSPEMMARLEEAFRYEAEICSYLDHPNLVRVFELAQNEQTYSLVMEFVNGLGLHELIGQQLDQNLPFPPDLALEIICQAGAGLDYAHQACAPDGRPLHIVHRDIKPANIMICRQGRVRLMDFGVARSILAQSGTTTGTIKGTLRYLSPEQAGGTRDIGPASDQFALALVLAELISGRPVYDGRRDHEVLLRALGGQVKAGIEAAEACCPGIAPVLTRALAFMPGDRYPSAGKLVEALRAVRPPTETLFGLAEWVHRGLERRAREAMAAAGHPMDDSGDLSEDGSHDGTPWPSCSVSERLEGGLEPIEEPARVAMRSRPLHDGGAAVEARSAAAEAELRRKGLTGNETVEYASLENGAWQVLEEDLHCGTNAQGGWDEPDGWVLIPVAGEEDAFRLERVQNGCLPPWMMPSSTTIRPGMDRR